MASLSHCSEAGPSEEMLERVGSLQASSADGWLIQEERSTACTLARVGGRFYRLVQFEPAGPGFHLGTLGAQYAGDCRLHSTSDPWKTLWESATSTGRTLLLACRQAQGQRSYIPVCTILADNRGNYHAIEAAEGDSEDLWVLFTLGIHGLVQQAADPARLDDTGDFQILGAPSIVQRHSTERLQKYLSRRVLVDHRLCNHCLRCVTSCSEMMAMVSPEGARLLGPAEDYCTNCGLCRKRCALLQAHAKQPAGDPDDLPIRIDEGGSSVSIYGEMADGFLAFLDKIRRHASNGFCYRLEDVLAKTRDLEVPGAIVRQIRLTFNEEKARSGRRPLMVSVFEGGEEGGIRLLVREEVRAAVVLQTETGQVEMDLAASALRRGLQVSLVLDWQSPAATLDGAATSEAATLFDSLGRYRRGSLVALWDRREVDVFLAPREEELPSALQQRVLDETGRRAHILAPHVVQALPVGRSPLLGELNRDLQTIFLDHPELMEAEARFARTLLADIPRNHRLIHARYRNMALASGHTACPTCAEVQVLAIPATMAIAMSLARGEAPGVSLTLETGCMSETLNKVGEVAQKVPGGRTVFGGGFAFGEAITMAQDHSIRRGHLPKARRYVVSQGGDGGAVIGLPAWLNALRQQSTLIRRRNPNVLHFIVITDTQVYSNTGGESSATSLLGMGTLTTPIGKFLLGNQNVQWSLINLAAEFPNILVGCGHSANRVAMQEFWHQADQLGQSGIRWDVTPCPETGKFFGEDPDDLAEVMANAGMLPELVFVGRFRKRVGPYHPEDREKPWEEWRRAPKPILSWLERDPRYKAFLRRNPQTGRGEPRNLAAHFLITQLESYRDQMNWQIDLETHLIRKAEDKVRAFLDELKASRLHYRHRLEQFPHAMLFNADGDWKPQLAATLEHEMVRRLVGSEELQRYASARDRVLAEEDGHLTRYALAADRLAQLLDPLTEEMDSVDGAIREILTRIETLQKDLAQQVRRLQSAAGPLMVEDPVEQELFRRGEVAAPSEAEARRRQLTQLLDRILEERVLGEYTELQQHRLSVQLRKEFLETGGVIRVSHAVTAARERAELRGRIAAFGPFAIGVASLAGDRGIAINRIFASFFTAKGAWAGMAWQFGSSKRGTPVLSATFVDSRPLQRKDAMHSLPVAVLGVTNFEEMKRQPDLFFGQLRPGGFLIINQTLPGEDLWRDLMEQAPDDIRRLVVPLREERMACTGPFADSDIGPMEAFSESRESIMTLQGLRKRIAISVWARPLAELSPDQRRHLEKLAAMVTARVISIDMDGIMQEVTGSANVVSNLVAVGPMFQALVALGFPFDWESDLKLLSQGFPEAVLRNARLLQHYYRAMECARDRCGPVIEESCRVLLETPASEPHESTRLDASARETTGEDPGDSLMIMGGTIAGMVLSQVAIPEHPLFYIGFPITPAGNPFYAMADAYANGHPYIVVDEVNPSEKVAAEKLIGVARAGGFLPVTFTASQGWRLFTEIIPQFVGARLEGLFLITKRALAAPNLNIEESHTDFMSFRDDGGIMLAPKSIQEYVATLYLARLLTHFARLPVIVGIGGITDTHKIGLVKVPPDERVRSWLRKTLEGFDFLEHKLINRQGDIVVHGPSGTSAVYQETQSELEKAHQAAVRIYPYAVRAVEELTGLRIAELEVACQSVPTDPGAVSALPGDTFQAGVCPAVDATGRPSVLQTVMILEGSLVPNAVEALRELEESGWSGMACLSVRLFNPFPEEQLAPWLDQARRIVVLDRSNSFGSVPPLASRVMGTLARSAAREGNRTPKTLRTLVGGLGGREIVVREMKEILLSTHLLFSPLEEWEGPLIARWTADDPILKTLLQEAAALDLRSTNRHTRVPTHLRPREAESEEYAQRLAGLSRLLSIRDYPTLLSHYSRVEIIGPREVLGETSLLQQIVIHVEIGLAREALKRSQATWRHAAVLLVYSQDPTDHDLARRSLQDLKDPLPLAPRLLEHWGVPVRVCEALSGTTPANPDSGCGEPDDASMPMAVQEEPPLEEIPFDPYEVERIELILKDLIRLQGERPLHYNPEDYERDLLERLQREPASGLHGLAGRLPPEEVERTLWSYQCRYRDVIDRTLQWEVLVQHHLPELKTLFTGANRERLKDLIDEFKQVMAGLTPEELRISIMEELERYLLDRCLVGAPKNPMVYLELFRSWVAPELLRESGLSP